MAKQRKKKKSRKILILFIVIGILGFAFGAYGFNLLDKIQNTKISQSDEELGIDETTKKSDKVINIALFGLDKRNVSEKGRSDSIMIASIDREFDKIKLTSIMRDTYVDIPGRGMDKINHAYAFGGPELAIKTINQNFDMNIRDFATVDFFGLEKIIDVIGGVEIEVKSNEVKPINSGVNQLNKLTGTNSPQIQGPGLQKLTGRQAVSYARIRKVGNGDFERTDRQRRVLEQVLKEGMGAGVGKMPKLLNTILPHVETSLSKSKILSLGTSTFTSGIRKIDQYRIPVDGYGKGKKINGTYYLIPETLEENIELLDKFIYQDEKITKRN